MDLEFVKHILIYANMRREIEPMIGPASQKLVKDLVDTGCSVRKIGKAVGRPPSYIKGVYNGLRVLPLDDLVRLIRYAHASGENIASK